VPLGKQSVHQSVLRLDVVTNYSPRDNIIPDIVSVVKRTDLRLGECNQGRRRSHRQIYQDCHTLYPHGLDKCVLLGLTAPFALYRSVHIANMDTAPSM
jgi:hypothetical protein